MLYRRFGDLWLSALGLGCAHLPAEPEQLQEVVDLAISGGVNYFDVGPASADGSRETSLGRALAKHSDADVFLCAHYPAGEASPVSEYLTRQLQCCGAEAFDFYLCDTADAGVIAALAAEKRAGRIRALGLNTALDASALDAALRENIAELSFCQLPLNSAEWTANAAEDKVEVVDSWDIPVWAASPLAGGRLARLKDEDEKALRELRPGEEPAAWAFRFLQSLPEVTVAVCGAASFAELQADIAAYREELPLNMAEMITLLSAAAGME